MADKSPFIDASSDDLWVGWQEDMTHPDAFCGGGGPGHFAMAGVLGQNCRTFSAAPHPRAPMVRYLALDTTQQKTLQASRRVGWAFIPGTAQQLPTSTQQQRSPPATITETFMLQKPARFLGDFSVPVKVDADGTSEKIQLPAETHFRLEGALKDDKTGKAYFWRAPHYKTQVRGKDTVVSELVSPMVVKGTIIIQTLYKPGVTPSARSGYGRGTTQEDEATLNTSLGFHEFCHREDLKQYLKTHPLPTFTGKVGMLKKDFDNAIKAFGERFESYFKDMDQYSVQQTDEVGYKKSEFDKNGPRQK
jgi:hypothetical protein